MRYEVPDAVHFEEATPRGLVSIDFPAGMIEPDELSDEEYVLVTRLIPSGVAWREGEAPPASEEAPEIETEESAPESDAPAQDPAPASADPVQE